MDTTLKLIREIKGLKQEAVAAMLGISQSAYSKIERGITRLSDDQKKTLYEQLGFHEKPTPENRQEINSIFFLELTNHYRQQLKFLEEENEKLHQMLTFLMNCR